MSHYTVQLHLRCLVPRKDLHIDRLVQAPDSTTALERARAIVQRQHGRFRIVDAAIVSTQDGPMPPDQSSTRDQALAQYSAALERYNEAKIQTNAAQGRTRAARRALGHAYSDLVRACSDQEVVVVPR